MPRFPLIVIALVAVSCGIQDTTSPVPQPDILILGRIAGSRPLPEEPGVTEVEVKAGLPDTLQSVMRREGRPIPQLEKDLLVRVRVTPDTVCIDSMLPADLDAFRIGKEVAVVPKSGTCAMVGTKELLAEAGEMYLFSAYQIHFLPRALTQLPASIRERSDPARINSSGTERTPLPVSGGRALYFAAGLLPPGDPKEQPFGAVRKGMEEQPGKLGAWSVGGFRPYRVAWGGSGWSAPESVVLPGLAADASAMITWINPAETACLVEVLTPEEPHRLFESSRRTDKDPWDALEKVEVPPDANVGDAQRFGAKGGALVWTHYIEGTSDMWLQTVGVQGQPLEPRINTLGAEWAPRVGPNNSLYFCREQRQLVFSGGLVREVRLPGKQRRPLLEAAPTPDGKLLFFRVPRYAPGEIDWDIAVAAKDGEGWGPAVLLDEWRPQ